MGLKPYYKDKFSKIYLGECKEIMPQLKEQSIAGCVTDPPYALNFMGKDWDKVIPNSVYWKHLLRILKPGAMLLSFGGTRTQHRLTCAIEDAGFEIRDCLMWLYGSGFPKSHNISKSLDKMAGAEREVVGYDPIAASKRNLRHSGEMNSRYRNSIAANDNGATITAPATDAAKQWDGYGTALKPAYESIILAMKPLAGTFAQNALDYGVAGLNIDGCRIGTEQTITCQKTEMYGTSSRQKDQEQGFRPRRVWNCYQPKKLNPPGRWPANILHDGSDEVMMLFPETKSGNLLSSHTHKASKSGDVWYCMHRPDHNPTQDWHGNSGSAARFFYCAKVSKKERGEGNTHPTVKPLSLMRYLCRLIKMPTKQIIIDPFMGSGTTLLAARQEGMRCIGIEQSEEYCEIAIQRLLKMHAEVA